MWRPAAILCLLTVIHDSVGGRWNPWSKSKSPIITIHGVYHFLYVSEGQKPQVHELDPGVELQCITDMSRSKIVALIEYEHVCSFVIPKGKGYQKVELLIIDNVAEHTIEVSQTYNPLQGFIDSGKKWGDYTRKAKMSPYSIPETGLITLLRVDYFQCPDGKYQPRVYKINPGTELRCITDPSRSKLVGILYSGQVCSFVTPAGKAYEKIEVLIIENVAEETMAVSQDYDPLEGFPKSGKYWGDYIRYAKIPTSNTLSSSGSSSSAGSLYPLRRLNSS